MTSPAGDISLPPHYALHDGYPTATDSCNLRSSAGLRPKTLAQATAAAQGSWYGCFITYADPETNASTTVAMGRIISDGGWYFHIADMAVLPDHQRRGLGDAVLKRLLARIRELPTDGEHYVSLMADVPGRRLYERNGFVPSGPYTIGMILPVKKGPNEMLVED